MYAAFHGLDRAPGSQIVHRAQTFRLSPTDRSTVRGCDDTYAMAQTRTFVDAETGLRYMQHQEIPLRVTWKRVSFLPFSGVVQKEMRKNTASAHTQNLSLPIHDIVIVIT